MRLTIHGTRLGAALAGLGLVWMASTGLARGATTAAAPPPAAAFGRLPDVQFVSISPNGKLLARDDEHQGGRRVLVWEIETGNTLAAVGLDANNKLRSIDWADDATILLNVSVDHTLPCESGRPCTYEWMRTLSVRLDGSKPTVLLMNDPQRKWVTGATLRAIRTKTPGKVTMSTWDYSPSNQDDQIGSNIPLSDRASSGWVQAVFEVDTRSGKGRQITTGTPYTTDWVVDADGMPIARSEWRPAQDTYSIVALQANNRWKEILRNEHGETLTLSGTTADGCCIVALGTNGADRSKAWALPLDGSPATVLYEDPEHELNLTYNDPYTHVVVGVAGTMAVSTHWFDPKYGSQQRALNSAFSGSRTWADSRSADGKRVVAAVDSLSRPTVFHLVDFDRSRADVIAQSYPDLEHAVLGETKLITYPARDGTLIPAYLTLPPGSPGRDLPVVVLPHGGPESHDDDGFNWMVQFLATRGYAVLQPQFRGSTGYGEAFRLAGYRQWGLLMQDDVSDGVRHLVASGTANPARICIAGLSYGGYAALAGAAFTPDLYACAISVNGVADLPEMLVDQKTRYGGDSGALRYWTDHIGPVSNPNVAGRSPSRCADSFRAPVLLMHGLADSVVPVRQSETMARMLKQAGKPVTFVKLEGEDHWLSRSATRQRVLEEMEAFLALYLKPAG